jgi:GTPase involved in cell partitioning and DNA repair
MLVTVLPAAHYFAAAGDPADGADGADVYVVCDPSLDSLLHLHKRKSWVGPKGAQGNPAMGSSGPKRNAKIKKAVTPPLEVPVPPGTVVKRKSTGQVCWVEELVLFCNQSKSNEVFVKFQLLVDCALSGCLEWVLREGCRVYTVVV